MPPSDPQLSDYRPTDLAHAKTLPSRWYLDPALLPVERERVFWRTWQWLGPAANLTAPGDFLAHDVQGEKIVAVRGGDSELRAFFNVCKHRAGPVAVGCGNAQTLRCPYHGWTYDLDGSLRRAREFEGVEDWEASSVRLDPVSAATWGPMALVNLDSTAPSLDVMLGEIGAEVADAGFPVGEMVHVERREYEVRCNWKVYVDNYLEGYHIPVAHPALYKAIDYDVYRVDTRRFHSRQHAPFRGNDQALYYWMFPNLMLNLYPDNLQTNVILPVDHERTLTIFDWFALPDLSAERRRGVDEAVEFSEQIQHEDIRVCEWVQERLGSRSYDTGRLSVKRENGVHHFHLLMHEFLTGNPWG